MHSQCNGPILLGTFAICITLAVKEPDISVKKPFGPKMCEGFCNWIAGCSSYIYETKDLACYPTPATPPKQNPERRSYHISLRKDKEMNPNKKAICRRSWMIFRTRRDMTKCRPILSRQPNLYIEGKERKVRMTRILIIMRRGFDGEFGRQLYLDNRSVLDYPFWDSSRRRIKAFAYIPSENKLLVSTQRPYKLFFMDVDEEKKTFIKGKFICSDEIAIDDHKQLVFMTVTKLHGQYLNVMSTNGKNMTSLFSLRSVCNITKESGGIVADHKRSLIHIWCDNLGLFQFTYQGVSKGYIRLNSFGSGYGLYLHGDSLYFQPSKGNFHLRKLSLIDHSLIDTCRLKLSLIESMLSVGNILYILPKNPQKGLIVVNMRHMKIVTRINLNSRNTYRCIMGLIP